MCRPSRCTHCRSHGQPGYHRPRFDAKRTQDSCFSTAADFNFASHHDQAGLFSLNPTSRTYVERSRVTGLLLR